jgi:GNAT superfamily N-acetyltransferase
LTFGLALPLCPHRYKTVEEYRALCTVVGWEAVSNFDAAPVSLQHSLFGSVATQAGQVVGIGRIVGDGALYFYIQDVAVRPEHQGRGLGRQIMQRLMGYLRLHPPPKAFVGSFAAGASRQLYERFGFQSYPEMMGIFWVAPGWCCHEGTTKVARQAASKSLVGSASQMPERAGWPGDARPPSTLNSFGEFGMRGTAPTLTKFPIPR